MRRIFIQREAAALAAALLLASAARASTEDRPNVLVLVADDVSDGDMTAIETPTFDALVERGTRFTRAYANPTCSPSRWSLHFGQFHTMDSGPVCDGYDADAAPKPEQASLSHSFSEAGYRTALFGKWHLGSYPGVRKNKDRSEPWEVTPLRYGFDVWRAGLPVNVGSCGGRNYFDWLRADDGTSAWSTEYVPHAIRDAFLGWHAEGAEDERPWLAVVCFQLAHGPFHSPPGTPNYDRHHKREKFEAQVRYLDGIVGELLAAVDPERTLVVYVADNGSPPKAADEGQDPDRMKSSTYEEGIHVPMVWAGPGVPRGALDGRVTHLADLLPTLAEAAGAPLAREGLDGVSLLPLGGEALAREHVWTGLGSNADGEFAVIGPRYKLRTRRGRVQLFDLEADPGERKDLAASEEHAATLAELKAVLARYVARLER